jgi:hypothetical protein
MLSDPAPTSAHATHLAEIKVAQLEPLRAVNQNIERLDIAVNESACMHCGHALGRLQHQPLRPRVQKQ